MSDASHLLEERMRHLNELAASRRERLKGTVGNLRARLNPAQVKQRAGNRAMDSMLDALASGKRTLREHPLPAIGIAALCGALLARGPLWRLIVKSLATGKEKLTEVWQDYRTARQQDEDRDE